MTRPVFRWLVRCAGRACVALSALVAGPAAGQSAVASPVPGEDLEIYVMTMGPGDLVWSRFGHNAIGIRDRTTGTDIVYN